MRLTFQKRNTQTALLIALLSFLVSAGRAELPLKTEGKAQEVRRFLQAGRYAQAMAWYRTRMAERSAQITPDDLNNYALVLALLGRYQDADFQLARLKSHADWRYVSNAALIELGQGRLSRAARTMENAIALCTDRAQKPRLYNNLGYIYEAQSDWDKAKSIYTHALSLQPASLKTRLNLADACRKNMDYEQAISLYRRVLKQDPESGRALNGLGLTYELTDQNRRALQVYSRLVRLYPQAETGYTHLATLYLKLGRSQAAEEMKRRMMVIGFKNMVAGRKPEVFSEEFQLEDKKGRDGVFTARLLDYVDVFFAEGS